MRTLDNYIGIEPFTVVVDESSKLRELAERARSLRNLSFEDKLEETKKLTHEGIPHNAYELWMANKDESAKEIVFSKHPLSTALETGMGCCRYQGALFFVLGYESQLGDKHFIQAAPVNSNVSTVFNEIFEKEIKHPVSIFTESLKDKSLDYSRQNPKIFEQAFKTIPGLNFYSYHRTPEGLVIAEVPNRHIKRL